MSIKSTPFGLPMISMPTTGTKFNMFSSMIITTRDWTIEKKCVGSYDLWDTAVKYGNVIFPPAFSNKNTISEGVSYQVGQNYKTLTYSGTKEWELEYACLWETGVSLSNIQGAFYRVILVDNAGNYIMKRTANNTKYQGLEAIFEYTTLDLAEKDKGTNFKLKVSLVKPSDLPSACDVVKPDLGDLQAVNLAKLIIDEASIKATTFDFRAVNALDELEYITFTETQKFYLTDSLGNALTATVTSKGNGAYTLTFPSTTALGNFAIAKPFESYYKSELYTMPSAVSCVAFETRKVVAQKDSEVKLLK